MSAKSDQKISEGLSHLRLAEKYLKTSLFKWKPDQDSAAAEYLKAATAFKNAKALEQAKESFIKVGELQKAMNSPFHAAKAYEQAGLLCKENKQFDEAVHWMELAALMFQEHGTPDTAALCLDKAAKMVEQEKPEKAIYLYSKACEVAEIESRPRQCAEYIGKAARLQVKCFKHEEAIKSLQQEIKFWLEAENYPYIKKVAMGIILLHLTQEDYVAADQFFRNCLGYPEFGASEEAGALEDLLRAYDDGDEEAGQQVLAKPIFKYLDNMFARLARDLKFPGGITSSRSAATTSTYSQQEDWEENNKDREEDEDKNEFIKGEKDNEEEEEPSEDLC
ncbi:gamma-soluble NSF attachment protein [Biomphalaria pfeifferi]|uniref:Gamma-soluble NSF attachment protein n=1 Tax=Biomphalaria pfeifferi TaxID=112525 RepID=A0AAD8B592_BIOPF|nr:gamma-soluble NSF attachment protein [Biomphalaria pfeifferi]